MGDYNNPTIKFYELLNIHYKKRYNSVFLFYEMTRSDILQMIVCLHQLFRQNARINFFIIEIMEKKVQVGRLYWKFSILRYKHNFWKIQNFYIHVYNFLYKNSVCGYCSLCIKFYYIILLQIFCSHITCTMYVCGSVIVVDII